jgi:cytochrome c-type biogenesis protein
MFLDYLISFFAGMVSVISPCVLPLIPVVVGHSLLRKETNETISFIGGFSLLLAIITILTVLFTVAINQYLYYFRIGAAVFLIVLGVFFILNPQRFKITYTLPLKKRFLGSFIMGFITCLAWSPCFGPYMVAIAAYSVSTGDIFYSTLNMLLFTLGFSLTIFLLAFTISKMNLEKLIKYSSGLRIISGFIIIIAGVYMLVGQLGIL